MSWANLYADDPVNSGGAYRGLLQLLIGDSPHTTPDPYEGAPYAPTEDLRRQIRRNRPMRESFRAPQAEQMPDHSAAIDQSAAEELMLRYRTRSLSDAGRLFGQELGLRKVPPLDLYDKPPAHVPRDARGYYDPASNQLGLQRSLRPNSKAAVMMHELAHAADTTRWPYYFGTESYEDDSPYWHHKNFKDFSADFPSVMREQRRIEWGQEPDVRMLHQYPYLRRVRPLSSNPLASPWRD